MNDFTEVFNFPLTTWGKNSIEESPGYICGTFNLPNQAKSVVDAMNLLNTTATKLAEQGYDAVKVLGSLPELMGFISEVTSNSSIAVNQPDLHDLACSLLEQCRGDV